MNYYERHLGDYARDTAHLTMLEHGAYTLLMDRYYGTEAGIPAEQAHRLARARSEQERAAVDTVLAEFFTLIDGVWVKNRIEEEIAKAAAKREAAQENGKKGGRPPKKGKPGKNPAGSGDKPSPYCGGTQQKPSGLSLGSETETQQEPSEKLTSLQSPVEETNTVSSANTGTSASADEREQVPAGARTEDSPPGVNAEAWRMFVSHHAAKSRGGWSIARGMLAKAQLAALQQAGEDVDTLLLWSITRNLADLADAARRRAADHEREQADAQRRRPGEGVADAAVRVMHANGSHLEPFDEDRRNALIPL
jgi:uncharacterized protein YdaU (DUF1376 family)